MASSDATPGPSSWGASSPVVQTVPASLGLVVAGAVSCLLTPDEEEPLLELCLLIALHLPDFGNHCEGAGDFQAATSPETETASQGVQEPLEGNPATTSEEVENAPAVISSSSHTDRSVWDDLADCESGNWTDDGFEEGSARWHVGGTDHRAQPRPSWSSGLDYGGIQFDPDSWMWAADVGDHQVDPNPANNSRETQIAVGKTLKDLQGWGAWPTCTKLLGLR